MGARRAISWGLPTGMKKVGKCAPWKEMSGGIRANCGSVTIPVVRLEIWGVWVLRARSACRWGKADRAIAVSSKTRRSLHPKGLTPPEDGFAPQKYNRIPEVLIGVPKGLTSSGCPFFHQMASTALPRRPQILPERSSVA